MFNVSTAWFIARHLSSPDGEHLSRPVMRIARLSIAIGLAFMMLSIAVVVGFQHSISDKVRGFTSDLQVVPFDNNQSMEPQPLDVKQPFILALLQDERVRHIQFTVRKPGIIKTDDQVQGIVFKGIGTDYDSAFLKDALVAGTFPILNGTKAGSGVLISQLLSNKLGLGIGDDVRIWFIQSDQQQARGRKMQVAGVYNTSLEEFDEAYIIGDIRHIQKINGWTDDEAGQVEIDLKPEVNLRETAYDLYRIMPYNLNIVTVLDAFPQIFNWLDLLDMNVIVLLSLLILVSSITLISTLLILIIERTSMIGLLKALGAGNTMVQRIFLLRSMGIILQGMAWGNVAGLLIIGIQWWFHLIKLPPESYYIDYVPVELGITPWVLLNVGVVLISLMALLIPTVTIVRIQPARALRYS